MPAGVRCPACQHKFVPDPWPEDGKLNCPKCTKALKVPKPKDAEDPLVGRAIGGFQLLRRLGAGAHAAVYEARPLAGGPSVAVKMLTREAAEDPENIQRFTREAEVAASLNHQNLVRIVQHGEERGIHWMAQELVPGNSLEHILDTKGAMPWREGCEYILQIARALAHMNERGVIHRDIKPANVLIHHGQAKLADLGFAKDLGAEAENDGGGLTVAGMSMGSPAYMAPEQVIDAKSAAHSADIYGLGATLYHTLCGDTPFTGKNAYQVMEKVLKAAPVPPRQLKPDLPPALVAFLMRVLEKKPAKRPADANAFVRELEAAVAAPEIAPKRAKGGGGQAIWWLAVALVGIGILVALWMLLVR